MEVVRRLAPSSLVQSATYIHTLPLSTSHNTLFLPSAHLVVFFLGVVESRLLQRAPLCDEAFIRRHQYFEKIHDVTCVSIRCPFAKHTMSSYNDKRHVSLAITSIQEDYGTNNTAAKRQEEATQIKNHDAQYWNVKLPSNELDDLMWGVGVGIPPPAAMEPRFQRSWAKKKKNDVVAVGGEGVDDGRGEETEEGASSSATIDTSEQQHHKQLQTKSDNILSAIEEASKEIPPNETVILEDIAWKQRSGFGKYSLGILNHEWEQRRVTLLSSGKLRYYALPSDKTTEDSEAGLGPRGEMDLRTGHGGEVVGGGDLTNSTSPSRRSSNASAANSSSSSSSSQLRVKIQARQRHENPGPTPFEIDITNRDSNDVWRFCFQSQSIQIEWLSNLKRMAKAHIGEEGECSDNNDNSDDEEDKVGEGLGADHGFQPGDHILRWEMLPIIYPIQVHGIVLEAGKNCVIIADFGLASYANHPGSEGLNTWDDKDDESHDVIMAAWNAVKPKEKKRLNVIVVTDPKEIRKWSKISYGDRAEEGEKEKKGFLSSFLGKSPKVGEKKGVKSDEGGKVEDANQTAIEKGVEKHSVDEDENKVSGTAPSDCVHNHEDEDRVEGEPDWFHSGGYKPRKRTTSTSSTVSFSEEQSVFSVERPESKMNELPKSDSAKLVLARTHFILENEDLLPPYHVFYSNSECIAVWAKTGRWSTLQAAVYLVSSSVGFGKSATMLTLSVAAAHMILVPALAVGGLAVMGAPLLFLKKSQAKWEKATMHLTGEFWSRAEPEVFVEAIEYWGGLRKYAEILR